ncbi:ATPase [Anaerosphaera multitolerans]|uniref:ATPase n=1 Tax=Anaerosphaera multitolerans TaxID=2487351 RepID=A0A437S574_9FIRM|nr:ATPase [Anaerosphaera multitolerans]RVU54159.1 ATPase [Anaerosphaera multitolerans]
MNIDLLSKEISNLQRKIDVDKGKKEILSNQLNDIISELDSLIEYEELLSKVTVLLQKTSSFGRIQAKKQIEELVTKCLQFIFETDIEFVIEITESRNIPQAEFYVISNYDGYSVKTKPEISRGGGVVDIISIALRLAFIQINKPRVEGPILFDEPGKHVSDDYIFNLGEFLKQSSELFRRQIIMVTHNNHLSQISDLSYNVGIKNGISFVEKHMETDL